MLSHFNAKNVSASLNEMLAAWRIFISLDVCQEKYCEWRMLQTNVRFTKLIFEKTFQKVKETLTQEDFLAVVDLVNETIPLC